MADAAMACLLRLWLLDAAAAYRVVDLVERVAYHGTATGVYLGRRLARARAPLTMESAVARSRTTRSASRSVGGGCVTQRPMRGQSGVALQTMKLLKIGRKPPERPTSAFRLIWRAPARPWICCMESV